jgi:transaldolase/glucose-6-phosphate isomerase
VRRFIFLETVPVCDNLQFQDNFMLNKFDYILPADLEAAFRESLADWQENNKVARVWAKDATVWTGDDEAKWLGWLDIAERELADLQKYRDFAAEARGFSDIVLLGMGGSSLCPEVFSKTFGVRYFHVLDSTVPAQIKTLESKLDLSRTLFIVASKSGSTLEPNCFKQYFYERVAETVGRENAGRQFIAVTDPGSKMQKVAESNNFSRIFFGDPEIGGRFSALSVFGMAAAASMQINVEEFLTNAHKMATACKTETIAENPGALLGTILGVCQTHGRDKLTIFTSPEIYDAGAWLEQLIAESTGKKNVSIIPIDREPVQQLEAYGRDRIFVHLKLAGAGESADFTEALDELKNSDHPFIEIELDDAMNLGQEFIRWEFATGVAGSIMGINPFNQPDVEAAKIEARKITDEYEKTGSLPVETPFFEENGIKLFSGDEYSQELTDAIDEKTLSAFLEAHLWNLEENDYFALLAYVEMNEDHEALLSEIREWVLQVEMKATCLGFGPRFLHSTGQAYKGGANNGVFLQITSDDESDLQVPDQKYTFGIVKAAQARGDFQVLLDRGRRALRIHFDDDVSEGLKTLVKTLHELTSHGSEN